MRKLKHPKLGEYVLLARWADKGHYDPWVIGYLFGIMETENGRFYRIREHPRWLPHCWRITDEEAQQRFEESEMLGQLAHCTDKEKKCSQ